MSPLTKAQASLLAKIAPRDQPIARHYAPAKVLAKLGLAVWVDAMFCDVLQITDKGRLALRDHPLKGPRDE